MSQVEQGIASNPGVIHGVCSALLVPRTPEHTVDYEAMGRLIRFQQDRGIRTFALNGATGEYTRSSHSEIRDLACFVKSHLAVKETLILGVGGADIWQIQALLDIGAEANVDGFLLPVPYYFPLEQQDFMALVSELKLPRPTFLYNLPSFTTPIHPETSVALCRMNTQIVGVKDSSGSLDTVTTLSEQVPEAVRIIGNDGALHSALAKKVCDGVVSGVAGVLPELMQMLYAESAADAACASSVSLNGTLMEYISWLSRFPVPWGLKVTAEFRGIFNAEFSVPLSEQRQTSVFEFKEWLSHNRDRLLISYANAGH